MNQSFEVEVAVINHRITALEKMPPRVDTLEMEVAGVKSELHKVVETTQSQTVAINDTHQATLSLRDDVRRLFWTGAGVFLACSALITAVKVLGIEVDL